MSKTVLVQIIGAPIACKEGMKDSWREVSGWTAEQLRARFGDAVEVRYFDLFDTGCPPLPANTQLPLVFVEGEAISSGGKISVPVIRHKIESILQKQTAGWPLQAGR